MWAIVVNSSNKNEGNDISKKGETCKDTNAEEEQVLKLAVESPNQSKKNAEN